MLLHFTDGQHTDGSTAYNNLEMEKQGFLKPGACLGLTGRKKLEFWTTTVVTYVPCIVLVLEQVLGKKVRASQSVS